MSTKEREEGEGGRGKESITRKGGRRDRKRK